MTNKEFEEALKYSLDYINEVSFDGIEVTTRDVWGRDVRRIIKKGSGKCEKDYHVDVHTLESWIIKFDIPTAPKNCDTFAAIVEQIAGTARGYVLSKLNNREKDDVIVHAIINGWQFMECDDLSIYENGEVVLVLYAVMLERVKK